MKYKNTSFIYFRLMRNSPKILDKYRFMFENWQCLSVFSTT